MSTNLPILNYDFALNQLGGNEALLTKMLGKFENEFRETPTEIADLIENNDIKNAKMKVHTVKGISGNLGLQALYDCATKLDAALRIGEFSQDMMAQFSSLVSLTCAEIQQMDNKESISKELEKPTLSPQDSKAELFVKLKKNEFIDDATLLKLLSGLQINADETKLLIGLIEELEYPQAIEIIEKIT